MIDEPTRPELVYYSHSKLRNQATCPARNLFSQLAKRGEIEEDPALPLVYGSAVHAEIESRLKYGTPRLHTFEEYLKKELTDKFPSRKLEPLADAMVEKEAEMVWCLDRFEENFYKSLQTSINPETSVEVTLQAPFRKGLLTGVADILFPDGSMADWKSGQIPSSAAARDRLKRDPQAVLYYYLAKRLGFSNPGFFSYVYLKGLNERRVQAKYKSGPRKGETYFKTDPTNPTKDWKYSFNTQTDDVKLQQVMDDRIAPLAKQFEERVYFKNESDLNCKGCQYRTICPDYRLPSREEVAPVVETPPEPTA